MPENPRDAFGKGFGFLGHPGHVSTFEVRAPTHRPPAAHPARRIDRPGIHEGRPRPTCDYRPSRGLTGLPRAPPLPRAGPPELQVRPLIPDRRCNAGTCKALPRPAPSAIRRAGAVCADLPSSFGSHCAQAGATPPQSPPPFDHSPTRWVTNPIGVARRPRRRPVRHPRLPRRSNPDEFQSPSSGALRTSAFCLILGVHPSGWARVHSPSPRFIPVSGLLIENRVRPRTAAQGC